MSARRQRGGAPTSSATTSPSRRSTSSAGWSRIDHRISDDELWEVLAAFGPLLEHAAGRGHPGRPASLRAARGPARLRRRSPRPCSRCCWPPTLATATAHARTYYTAAVEIAFAVAAIDLHTSERRADRHRGLPRDAPRRHRGDGGGVASRSPPPVTGRRHARRPPSRGRAAEDDPPPRPIDELLGRARRPRRASTAVKHEVKLVTNLLRVQKIREERGLPVLRPEPPPDLHGQPGHREDHRRPPPRPDLPHPRRRRARATSWRPTGPAWWPGYVGQTAPLVHRPLRRGRRGRAPDRRGVLAGAGRRARLRAGGDRHHREAHRGPARPDRRGDGGLPGRDGGAHRVQPGPALTVPEGDPLPRLHDRRAPPDHGRPWARRAATDSTRAPRRGRGSGSTRSPATRASATAGPPATCSSTPSPPRPPRLGTDRPTRATSSSPCWSPTTSRRRASGPLTVGPTPTGSV